MVDHLNKTLKTGFEQVTQLPIRSKKLKEAESEMRGAGGHAAGAAAGPAAHCAGCLGGVWGWRKWRKGRFVGGGGGGGGANKQGLFKDQFQLVVWII